MTRSREYLSRYPQLVNSSNLRNALEVKSCFQCAINSFTYITKERNRARRRRHFSSCHARRARARAHPRYATLRALAPFFPHYPPLPVSSLVRPEAWPRTVSRVRDRSRIRLTSRACLTWYVHARARALYSPMQRLSQIRDLHVGDILPIDLVLPLLLDFLFHLVAGTNQLYLRAEAGFLLRGSFTRRLDSVYLWIFRARWFFSFFLSHELVRRWTARFGVLVLAPLL